MFFMSHKRFEEAVWKRAEELAHARRMEDNYYKLCAEVEVLREQVKRLEGKGKMDGVSVEVCNVKDR